MKFMAVSFVALILLAGAALAQLPTQPGSTTELKAPPGEIEQGLSGREGSGSDLRPFLANFYPEDLPPLFPKNSRAVTYLRDHRIRSYGWLDGGITTVSGASGLVTEAPTSDRFSNQAMLNGAWLIVERKATKELSWGFRSDFYVGSDAALLRPEGSFGPTGPRWGTDFRQAYLTLYIPGVFGRGIEFDGGRINNPTGFETLMSPYRPMYSETYFWIHYEVGSTALQATVHPTGRLDLVLGTVMGYNTLFELRGRAPDYIARAIYRPRGDKDRQWLATVYTGPEPAAATQGHVGRWQTLAELQAREVWTRRIAQVIQVHYMADVSDPTVGRRTSSTQGAFVITAFKLNDKAYINTRAEWFSDPHGVRITTPGSYGEATLGLSLHPTRWIAFRPEVRGDFSGQHSFGGADNSVRHRNELSVAFEMIYKGRLF